MQILRKILIIRFSSLGDILLTTPFIRILRKSFPDARIDFLVKREFISALEDNPHISSVIAFSPDSAGGFTELKNQIRSERYDAIFDLQNSIRSRMLRFHSGAAVIKVVNKYVVKRFLLVTLKWNFYREVTSVVERYLMTGREFGLVDDGVGLEFNVPQSITDAVTVATKENRSGQPDSVLGFAPAARHATKRWSLEYYRDLAALYSARLETRIMIFGGDGDKEYCDSLASQINGRVGREVATSYAGRFSLAETAAAMDQCSVIVSNDTGLMHLAAARKRNIVAIFGSTVREFGFFPYGSPSVVLEERDLSCRPCSHIGRPKCPKGHFKCMNDITPARVLNAITRFAG